MLRLSLSLLLRELGQRPWVSLYIEAGTWWLYQCSSVLPPRASTLRQKQVCWEAPASTRCHMVPGELQLAWGGCFLSWGQPPQRLDQLAVWPGRGRAVADLEAGAPPGKLRQGRMALSPAEMGAWAGGQGHGQALGGWARAVMAAMCRA